MLLHCAIEIDNKKNWIVHKLRCVHPVYLGALEISRMAMDQDGLCVYLICSIVLNGQ